MHKAVDILSVLVMAVGLVGLWLCLIHTEPKKPTH